MRILRENTMLLLIDIQERLFPHMAEGEELLRKTTVLLEGMKVLGVPMIFSEQYPRGLGSTVQLVKSLLGDLEPAIKSAFSCCDDEGISASIRENGSRVVILCGIEAHVCVMQTAIDLLGEGKLPVVVEDCISSRNLNDKAVAVERMRSEGALITTCESILFELARVSGTGEFKAISRIVK